MPQQMIWFFVSIAFSLIAWGIVAARYIWPELRILQRSEALRPLLILHIFRFIGLAFLVPGVVSPDLPSAFAHWGHHCSDTGIAFAATVAQRAWRCRRLDLQPVGFSRYPQRFLPSQSRRTIGGAVGSHILPSDCHCAAAADYARTRLPSSFQHQPEPALQESRHPA
jgi:hypothetical protein